MEIAMCSSSYSLNTNCISKCKVCSSTGHGLHYGVIACRACAAFFRRTFVLNKKYKCRRRNGQCGYDLGTIECRFCRFKKCLEVGMVTDSIRLDEVYKVLPTHTIQDVQCVLPEQHGSRIGYEVVDWKTKKISLLIDVDAVIAESRTVLELVHFNDSKNQQKLNSLEIMTEALNKIRQKQETAESLHFLEVTEFGDIFKMWHLRMKDTAEWLMHSEEFRKLPEHERIAFFKTVWGVWRRFERYTMSAKLFGKRCINEKMFVHSNQFASYSGKLKIGQSMIFNPKYGYVLNSFVNDWFEVVVKPFVQLNFSPTEVTYMLCQIVWSYAGRRLQGQTLAASERFLEEIGNNLHQYYRELPNIESYSGRVVKMMRIVKDVLNIQLRRENLMDLAFVFEYFNVTFTDPDFFRV